MKVGPINSFDGFPVWYKDENGLRLQLNTNPADPFSGITFADLPDPLQPVSFPDNYPSEAFYTSVEAEMTTGTGERARLVLALEAAFLTEVPQVGDQIVFGRVRIRVAGLQPNVEYTVTHPYGVDTFIAEPDGEGFGEINFTEDIGGMNGGEFQLALNSRIHPFLIWDPTVTPDAPEGYIGDPAVAHSIVGSLFIDRFGQPQNVFRIEGPGIGVGSPDRSSNPNFDADNTIETNLFTVLGKISTISGVDVNRVTYTQIEDSGGFLDVFATSDDTAQTISVTGSGFSTTLLEGRNSQYFARIQFEGSRPPVTIAVRNTSDDPISRKDVSPVDFIEASANYDTDTQILRIEATSSDSIGLPDLSLEDFGAGVMEIPPNGISTTNLVFAPAHVTIISSAGGSRTIPVTITGSADGPIPVSANAGEDQSVIIDTSVTLNGTNSTGSITSFSWAQLSGTSVTLVEADTATPTFTAPSVPEPLIFELTVQGVGGPSTSTVQISVLDFIPAPIANAGGNQTVQRGTVVQLTGSATGDVTSFQWEQVAGTPVQLTNATTSTASFTFPTQSETLMFQLTATGPGGATSATVQVASLIETLTVSRAEYRTGDLEWRIIGLSNLVGSGVLISIYIGSTLTGTLLSAVPVDALGNWEYRVKDSTEQPNETRSISIQSSSGGSLLNIPLNIRN